MNLHGLKKQRKKVSRKITDIKVKQKLSRHLKPLHAKRHRLDEAIKKGREKQKARRKQNV